MQHRTSLSRPAQKGSILVQFALLLLLFVTILGVVQIGYMYSVKRDLQRIADLAALESANAYKKTVTTCTNAKAAGVESIDKQWPQNVTPQSDYPSMVECGNWNKGSGFKLGFGSNGTYDAVRVTLKGESLKLLPFTGDRVILAVAIAATPSDPIASFSVGSGVARLDGGLLNSLLTMLLGTKVNLELVDYKGLASANVNLLGIVNALKLNAGTYDELLAANVSLRELLEASITAASNSADHTADIGVAALQRILALTGGLNLTQTHINLFKDLGQRGLIDLGLYRDSPSMALQADVSLLNLLLVGLQVAQADAALKLGTGIDLGVLASATVQVKIIEPPVIAVGPAGTDANGQYRTTAHTGQVRAVLDIKALNALASKNDLLDLNLLLVRLRVSLPAGQAIHLPIYVEVGSADARLEEIICYNKANTHYARIGAKPGIAYVLLGTAPQAMTNTTSAWTGLTKNSFDLLNLNLKATALLDLIPLLDAPIQVKAKLDLAIDNPKNYQQLEFNYDPSIPRSEQDLIKSVGSRQQLGASIGSAINKNLLQLELNTDGLSALGLSLKVLSDIVDGLVNNLVKLVAVLLPIVNAILSPILALLDSILGPLLQLLGLQIGYADVELLSVDCNPAQLVY